MTSQSFPMFLTDIFEYLIMYERKHLSKRSKTKSLITDKQKYLLPKSGNQQLKTLKPLSTGSNYLSNQVFNWTDTSTDSPDIVESYNAMFTTQ